jgi:hypothetical protein
MMPHVDGSRMEVTGPYKLLGLTRGQQLVSRVRVQAKVLDLGLR